MHVKKTPLLSCINTYMPSPSWSTCRQKVWTRHDRLIRGGICVETEINLINERKEGKKPPNAVLPRIMLYSPTSLSHVILLLGSSPPWSATRMTQTSSARLSCSQNSMWKRHPTSQPSLCASTLCRPCCSVSRIHVRYFCSFSFRSPYTSEPAVAEGEAQQPWLQHNMHSIYCNEACNLFTVIYSLQQEEHQRDGGLPHRRNLCTTACLSLPLSLSRVFGVGYNLKAPCISELWLAGGLANESSWSWAFSWGVWIRTQSDNAAVDSALSFPPSPFVSCLLLRIYSSPHVSPCLTFTLIDNIWNLKYVFERADACPDNFLLRFSPLEPFTCLLLDNTQRSAAHFGKCWPSSRCCCRQRCEETKRRAGTEVQPRLTAWETRWSVVGRGGEIEVNADWLGDESVRWGNVEDMVKQQDEGGSWQLFDRQRQRVLNELKY